MPPLNSAPGATISSNAFGSSLKYSPIFCPKLGGEQKKRSSLKCPPIKRTEHALCEIKPYAQLAKGGPMHQFCLLFYAILQSWRYSHGTMAPPLNTPLVLWSSISSLVAKSLSNWKLRPLNHNCNGLTSSGTSPKTNLKPKLCRKKNES